jgi:hypothetical protein
MNYTQDTLPQLASDISEAIKTWGSVKIDELFPNNILLSHYLKKGLANYLTRSHDQTAKMVQQASLFIADDQGSISLSTLIDDLTSMLHQMQPSRYKLGAFNMTIGQGEVCVEIPHNAICDLLFGELGKVRITSEDIKELAGLIGN